MFIKKSEYERMMVKIEGLEGMLSNPEAKRKYTLEYWPNGIYDANRSKMDIFTHIGTCLYKTTDGGIRVEDCGKIIAHYYKQPNRILGEDCHD